MKNIEYSIQYRVVHNVCIYIMYVDTKKLFVTRRIQVLISVNELTRNGYIYVNVFYG